MDLKSGLDWRAQQSALRLCDAGQKYKALDNLATKTLGVLQENGIYPSVLFLRTRKEDREVADAILKELHALAQAKELGGERVCSDTKQYLKYYSEKICSDLDTLLLTRSLWEQTLIYTRYAAKACGKDKA